MAKVFLEEGGLQCLHAKTLPTLQKVGTHDHHGYVRALWPVRLETV